MPIKSSHVLFLFLLVCGPRLAPGYAVLTHEAIIDSAWDNIKPILLHRFPNATPDDLKKAHAYAYGGCIIQDMGYYPLASHYFSDLVHYVRSGDFVVALLRDAQDLNELAFAIGALAHYSADNNGHPIAVNRAVAIEYPELRAKYGHEITYAQAPVAHLKTEFSFDVVEVAQGNYAPDDYHNFIGFQVSKELVEKAFHETYGLEMKDVFKSISLALGTYRYTVSSILPEATKVAWELNKDAIIKAHPGMTKRKFLYYIKRSSFEKEWGKEYQRPGIFARILAFLFRIIPKVGPFRTLKFKQPTPQTVTLFMASFVKTEDFYRTLLSEQSSGHLHLDDTDLDTGRPTRPGEYPLADRTYAKLIRDLARKNFNGLTPELRAHLLAFFRNPKPPAPLKKKEKKKEERAWADTLAALEKLKSRDIPGAVATPANTQGE